MARERTSIAIDRTMSLALNLTSGWYFVRPCCWTRRCLTVLKKYQLSPASTIKMMTFDILSHTSLIWTKTLLGGGFLEVRLANIGMAARDELQMCRNPDDHHHDVHSGDDEDSSPFDPPYSLSMLCNERDTVDDDLHKQLDFKYPTKKNEE